MNNGAVPTLRMPKAILFDLDGTPVDSAPDITAAVSELLAGRNFHDIAVIGDARSVVIDEHRVAAAPRPGFQLHGSQVAHIESRDDLEPLVLDPARVGCFLFGGKFLCQVFRDEGVLGHAVLLAVFGFGWLC